MEKMNLEPGGQSPASEILAYALARCGACRESYYSGQLSGVRCSNLMRRMHAFCSLFFHRRAQNWGLVTEAIPSTHNLEFSLKNVAMLYSGSGPEDRKGVEFYLRTQEKWTAKMVTDWDALSGRFFNVLRDAIGREPVHGRVLEECEQWRQPLKMPKLHCLLTHCIQFVMAHGYLGALSEQSFEHFQQVSAKTRRDHAPNQCLGGQIFEDIQYAWISSSPLLQQACFEAEIRRASNSKAIKKEKIFLACFDPS